MSLKRISGDLWEVLVGDVIEGLRELPDNCVHCLVSSPPYFGVRDYDAAGQFGQELVHDCLAWARGIHQILSNEGNRDDLIAFMLDKNLPVDEIEAGNIADEITLNPPAQGFLTISNALQWRLQYGRVIERAGREEGVVAIYRATK